MVQKKRNKRFKELKNEKTNGHDTIRHVLEPDEDTKSNLKEIDLDDELMTYKSYHTEPFEVTGIDLAKTISSELSSRICVGDQMGGWRDAQKRFIQTKEHKKR